MPAEEHDSGRGTPLDKGADEQPPATVTGVDISAARRAWRTCRASPAHPSRTRS